MQPPQQGLAYCEEDAGRVEALGRKLRGTGAGEAGFSALAAELRRKPGSCYAKWMKIQRRLVVEESPDEGEVSDSWEIPERKPKPRRRTVAGGRRSAAARDSDSSCGGGGGPSPSKLALMI